MKSVLEVSRLNIDARALRNIPKAERELVITCGHVINELNVFVKTLAATGNTQFGASGSTERLIYSAKNTMMLRNLIGKLHEAHVAFGKRVVSNPKFGRSFTNKLPENARGIKKRIDVLMNDGLLARVRNKLSFHYDDKQKNLDDAFMLISERDDLIAVTCNTLGNSFFHYSEAVVLTAMLIQVDQKRDSEDMTAWIHRTYTTLIETTLNAAKYLLALYMEVLALITNEFVTEVSREQIYVLAVGPRDTQLPFFTN